MNVYITQFTHLKVYIFWWVLVYLKSCAAITTILEHFQHP